MGVFMKKILIILTMVLFSVSLFADDLENYLKNEIGKLDCVTLNSKSEEKPNVTIKVQSDEEFLKSQKMVLNDDLFPNKNKVSIDDIKAELKKGKNIYRPLYRTRFYNYSWHDGEQLSYSIAYEQYTSSPINSFGFYTIFVFYNNKIYTIGITNSQLIEKPREDFDSLKYFFVFKLGQKQNPDKGLEQTQGYYCVNEDSAKTFYRLLKEKDSSLPESAIKFQNAAEKIFDILNNYK